MVATPYPLPGIHTFDSLPSTLQFADAVAGAHFLGLILVIMIFGVVFLASGGIGVEKRLLAACFFAFISSVVLTAAGLLAVYVTPALLIAVFILWALTKRYD